MGNLEQIFLLILAVVVVAYGIAALICWVKTKRRKEQILLAKIGIPMVVCIAILYVAVKILTTF